VALHAKRSHGSVQAFRAQNPRGKVVLALTGTDLYGEIHQDPQAQRALADADLLVALQPLAKEEVPTAYHPKLRIILQSARAPARIPPKREDAFDVCVMGHLRPVKDPFRTALAARSLPARSKIRVVHVGAPLTAEMEARAQLEREQNRRYEWVGELPRMEALRILGRSRLLSLTSISEGGANVVAEALACRVPVVSSRIPGSIGLLGEDYPGYFQVGDTRALAELLLRAEEDAAFYADLQARCARLRRLVSPRLEKERWANLVAELLAPRPQQEASR
jgi:putative glycosyltransferase (TIGR04348 family)